MPRVPRHLCDNPHTGDWLRSVSLRMLRPTSQLRVRRFLRSEGRCGMAVCNLTRFLQLRSALHSRKSRKRHRLAFPPDAQDYAQECQCCSLISDFSHRSDAESQLLTSIVRMYCSI